MASIRVQAADFDPGAELSILQAAAPEAGAIGSFIGIVRSNAARPIVAMTHEH